jgi:osmoprotectant transport system permease protein
MNPTLQRNIAEGFAQLPNLLSNHLKLVVVALGVGLLISLPVAVLVARLKLLRYPTLTAAGVIQTVPSLALLALMVPMLELARRSGIDISSFGFLPAVAALTLYSILPILRNTVTGILGVEPAMTEAARGVGMTSWQSLTRVELPLAMPVIIAGIRTATVWVVGIATLATPVGQPCLGNYIFSGLQTRNWTSVLFGVVFAAALAIVLDTLIAGVQRAAEQRRVTLGYTCGGALAVVFVLGLVSPRLVQLTGGAELTAGPAVAAEEEDPAALGTVRIGAKTFTEQYILARTIDQLLADAGYQTRRVESLGSTIVFDQLAAGELDVYVDYSGTIWANYMKRQGAAPAPRVIEAMTWWLADEHRIRCLGPLGFENAYALAMRSAQAEELGIETIADLAEHSAGMKIGGDYEFFSRPEWRAIRDGYGLRFTEEVSYDSTFMYQAVADGEVDVISAFSSDGRIAAFDLVVLDDPKQVIPPYDAVLLVGPRVADSPRLVRTLRPLIRGVPLQTMQHANQRVDVEGRTIDQATAELLESLR